MTMRKPNQPENDDDWIMVNRESSAETYGSLENEVASTSSGDESWSIRRNGGSEFDNTEEAALTIPNTTSISGIEPTNSRDSQQMASVPRDSNQSLFPEQTILSPKISQSNYVLERCQSPAANSTIPRCCDHTLSIPRTRDTTTPDELPRLFPHLSKFQIKEWVKRDPQPLEMAFIGEGAYVSGARNYKMFPEEFAPQVSTHQQNADPAVTTEQSWGETVDPDDPASSDDESL